MSRSPLEFANERSFFIALEYSFSKAYPFGSVNVFKQVIEERYVAFKIEVRQTVLGLKEDDRLPYLDELKSELKQAQENLGAVQPNDFIEIQNSYVQKGLRYVSDQQKRYDKNQVSTDLSDHSSTVLSFQFREPDTDALAFIYKTLNKEIDFIDKKNTSLAVFKEVFTSKDLYILSPKKQIRFNCQTNEAAYVLRQMQWLFDELTFSNIGKAGCFFSRKGVLLTTSNLRQSSLSLPKNKELIDVVMRKVRDV